MTSRVGLPRRQNFIATRDELHIDAALRVRRCQRIDKDMDAVVTGKRREPEIGNNEPLSRHRLIVGADVFQFLRLRHHDVDAGLKIADRLIHRERSSHFLIERRIIDRQFTLPYLNSAGAFQVVDLIRRQTFLEIAVAESRAFDRVDQIAVADPINFDRDRLGIDADYRNTALAGARQHVVGRGKTRLRPPVAHINGEVCGLRQRLMHDRRQTRPQCHRVSAAVLQPFDAKLLFSRG